MAVKSRPSAVSRWSVIVVLFDRRSTSLDCSAVKRCCEVSGTYLTFSESPKMAAETARQTSTSRPTHLPWLSATAKPAMPVGTPQITAPRALMASRSLPAIAAPDARATVSPTAAAIDTCFMVSPNGRSILQAALRPQLVEAALDLERRALADIALEALAIVTD